MTALESASKQRNASRNLSLFALTWPIFLELFLFMAMGIADTFMLSVISDNAVSGVGAANQFLQIAILVLGVVGNGASIVVAQYLGSRLYQEVAKISAIAVSLNTIVGIAISIIFLLFGANMLQALNLQGEVFLYADQYLSIVGGAIFLQAVMNSLSAIIRVHGYTKETMYVSLGMNIIHVFGNYVLIFGKFGFQKWACKGSLFLPW